jgi:predicted CoA-substrate-specific enzyme activase
MPKGYLGVDIGSISTKGAIIDDKGSVLAAEYLWTEGNPIRAVRRLLAELEQQMSDDVEVVAVGTTGSARELVGAMLEAQTVKNEITAHAMGTLSRHPDVATILEIGGQDSKIILIRDGVPVDYAMNTLCAAGTGAFLTAQAKRLEIPVEEFGDRALHSKRPTRIAGRCTVFAESDLVHKAQVGHPVNDIIAGLCAAIVENYLNNVGKGKEIRTPVVFQGGVSKNVGVVKAFSDALDTEVLVDDEGHLMGAIGAALLAQAERVEAPFSFAVQETDFETRGDDCGGCANNCEVVVALRDGIVLDGWGSRCDKGVDRIRDRHEDTAEHPADAPAQERVADPV